MKSHNLFLRIILFSLPFLMISRAQGITHSSYRSLAENVGEKATEIELSTSYFSTTGHFDQQGEKIPLRGEEAFNKLDLDAGLRYGMSRDLEFRMTLRGRRNTSFVDDPTRGKFNLQAEGLESYGAGFKYNLYKGPRESVALDLSFRQSSFHNDEYDANDPYRSLELGDEVRELGVGFHIVQKLKAQFLMTYSAIYNYRTNNFSNEILYLVEGAFKRPQWALFGGIEGIHSLKSDSYADNPQAKPRLHTGSTYLFNSVNRAHFSPMAGLSWSWSAKSKITVKGRKVLSGVSTDEGYEGMVMLSFYSGGVSSTQKLVESFKEYEIEASVIKVSPREIFIKIDKGMTDDVQKGMVMDIFQFDYLGGNVLVGRGVIYEVEANHSILKLGKKFQDIPIKVGFVARGKYSE